MNPFDVTPVSDWNTRFIIKHQKWIDNQLLVPVLCWNTVLDNLQAKRVQCLLEHNCDSNARVRHGYDTTPLILACLKKLPKCVQVLLQYGADPNQINDNGWTPLMESCDVQDTASMKLLLEHKANVHAVNATGNTVAQYAAFCWCEDDVVKSLFEIYGVNPTTPGCKGDTVFHYCIIYGNEWLFAWLLDRYPEYINIRQNDHSYLLRICLLRGRVHFIKYLLEWAHCDVWSDLHLLSFDEEDSVTVQTILLYATQRISMQIWAAVQLQKSHSLCQYFQQHPLCDVHLCDEWITWFTNKLS